MTASPATASVRTFTNGLVSRNVSPELGRSFVSDKGVPQAGQVTRQAFRQCFGTAPDVECTPFDRTPGGAAISTEADELPGRSELQA